MKENMIITIGRQYGSGGREVGQKLADALGIPCYDKELLTVAAEKSGFCKEMFEHHDEKPVGSFLYSLVMGAYSGDNLPINHKLFLAQFEAIRSLADQGSCVIIGRCGDYALEDYKNCIRVFIHANLEERVRRAVTFYGVEIEKAEDVVQKIDKQRANYYNFYSGKNWGDVENYDITLDSSILGIDHTVTLIQSFIKLQKKGMHLNNENI